MSHMLPFEVLQIQAQVLELFASLYPSEDELRMSDETRQAMKHLQDGTDATNAALVNISSLDFTLDLELQDDKDSATERSFPIRIGVQLPVRHSSSTTPLLTLHQPPWLTRAAHDTLSKQLSTALPQDEQGVEILLDYLDKLKEAAPEYYPKVKEVVSEVDTDEEFRVWLTLTSLSTREKRDNMVNWAPDFNLTGFVLAGKPALLVLEGTTRSVDAFMSDIKARSWADIMPHQKKVSERYREPLGPDSPRVFSDMVEITHLISKGGHRGNRIEMGEVRDYLTERGLGEAFGIVLGKGAFA